MHKIIKHNHNPEARRLISNPSATAFLSFLSDLNVEVKYEALRGMATMIDLDIFYKPSILYRQLMFLQVILLNDILELNKDK